MSNVPSPEDFRVKVFEDRVARVRAISSAFERLQKVLSN